MNLTSRYLEERDWHRIFIYTSTLFFFVSFLRAIISISIGALLAFISEINLAIFLLSPILLSYIFYRLKTYYNFFHFTMALMWVLSAILSLLDEDYILRFIFLIVGFSISLLSLFYLPTKEYFAGINLKEVVIWFLGVDFIIKAFNYGQEPLVSITNGLYQIMFPLILLIVGIPFLVLHFFIPISIVQSADMESKNGISTISQFILLFIYIYLINSPGIFIQENNFSLALSFIIGGIMLLIAIFASSLIDEGNQLIIIGSAAILIITTLLHPWIGFGVIFWVLSPLTFILLFTRLGSIQDGVINDGRYHLGGYFLMVVFSFIILSYELFIVFQILGVIIMLNIIWRRKITLPKVSFNFKTLLVILSISILMVPLFYPSDSGDPNPTGITAMTYNIHYGTDAFGHDNVDRLIDFISTQLPTIIGFQEMTISSPLNGYGNVYAKLLDGLEPLGYIYHALSKGGQYALRNAVFSMYPIIDVKTIEIIPVLRYQRTAIVATIDLGDTTITFVSVHTTHVGSSKGTPERLEQIKFLVDELSPLPSNIILTGDFNSIPTSYEQVFLHKNFNDSWSDGDGFTAPAEDPNKRIDYIFYKGLNATSCVVTQTIISDHLPLYCEFKL